MEKMQFPHYLMKYCSRSNEATIAGEFSTALLRLGQLYISLRIVGRDVIWSCEICFVTGRRWLTVRSRKYRRQATEQDLSLNFSLL
ncbi:hypothetical protein WS89_24025 [Burkholderia sp. MSMB1072]|nr:hypothetical protein WS89_24025 [Burkholderia sp. MSMB1072]